MKKGDLILRILRCRRKRLLPIDTRRIFIAVTFLQIDQSIHTGIVYNFVHTMLEPIRHILSQQRTVLCSSSPRRKEILKQVGLVFEVIPSHFAEDLDKDFAHPCEYVKENAKQKAIDVWKRLVAAPSSDPLPDLIIGADTVVTMDGRIYEKPKDEEDAFFMLSTLSGQRHTVFTGVALLTKSAATAAPAGN